MTDAGNVLQYVAAGGFALVAASAIRRWLIERDAVRATIAGALFMLAATAVLGRLGQPTHYRYRILSDLALVTFIGSGYLMLEFRHRYVPLHRWWRIGALAASAASAGLA